MALQRTPIFRNLDYQTSWFGLTFEDMPFILAPIGVSMLGMIFLELPPTLVIVVAVATIVGLALLKYGKPPGYLWLLLEAIFLPRHLSHKARDAQLSPLGIVGACCKLGEPRGGMRWSSPTDIGSSALETEPWLCFRTLVRTVSTTRKLPAT